ncbi:MAG TPA: hypothetical protein EYG86_06675 [Crocinitomicaceae bacterium]|nr:hypothetical protein [Crocinitomicaceae bacterium]
MGNSIKDKVESSDLLNDKCDCVPYEPIQGYSTGYYYEYEPTFATDAQFNPNNNDEILYLEQGANIPDAIYKLNLLTNQKELIYSGGVIYNPVWGKQDWIVFSLLAGNQIWKIKSNGDSLSQVTYGGFWFHPKWNFTGDEFTAYRGFVNPNEYYQGGVWSVDGALVDTFSWISSLGDWNNSNDYFGVAKQNIFKVINPYTNQTLSTISSGDTNVFFGGFRWISDSEGIIIKRGGIYRINIWTKKMTQLKCVCNSVQYSNGSVSNDGTKILYIRNTFTRFGGSGLSVINHIVTIDTQLGTEIVLNVP